MATPRKKSDAIPARPLPTTDEGIESHLISLAILQTEKQLREGNAPTAVQVHYLKLATMQHKLEMEKLRSETVLANERAKNLAATEDLRQLTENAMTHFTSYETGEAVDRD